MNILFLIAVPFDEDERDKTVWFLDHDYLEQMSSMFKKVNGNFRTVNYMFVCQLFIVSDHLICDFKLYFNSVPLAREKIVGWYHTGPKLHQNDVKINELIRRYCTSSVLVIIDAKPRDLGLPTESYRAVEEVHEVWNVILNRL